MVGPKLTDTVLNVTQSIVKPVATTILLLVSLVEVTELSLQLVVAQTVLMITNNQLVQIVLHNVKLVLIILPVLNVLMDILVSQNVHLLQPELLQFTLKISQLVQSKLLTVLCNVCTVNNSLIIVSLNAQKTEKLFHIVTVLILTMLFLLWNVDMVPILVIV
jgi:hypothetical protein